MVSSEDSAWDVPPSIFGTRAGGPTVQRLVLGSQLHRLRESRGITAEQAAEAIRGSHPRSAGWNMAGSASRSAMWATSLPSTASPTARSARPC